MKHNLFCPARNRGFSLIEILVSLLILAVGILGMLALQSHTIKSNISSDQRTHALMVLDSIEETILADRANQGTSICAANALDPFKNALTAAIDNTVDIDWTGGASPCPTRRSNGMNVYRFQVKWTELTAFASTRAKPTTIIREVRL